MFKKIIFSSSVVLLALGFVGCGDDNNSDSNLTTAVEDNASTTISPIGYYQDSAIEGVDYICGNKSGVTGTDGNFSFQAGQGCEFKLGNMLLRRVEASQLHDGVIIVEDNLKSAQMLQSFDNDGNASNGITITNEIKTALREANISTVIYENRELEAFINELRNSVSGFNGEVIDTDNVARHLNQNEAIATATEQTKALLSDKTFYVADMINGVVEFSFDGDVSQFIHPADRDGNTQNHIIVIGDKLFFGDGRYYTIENNSTFITMKSYNQYSQYNGEFRLFSNRADAQDYYDNVVNTYIPLTEDMLVGKTFYVSYTEEGNQGYGTITFLSGFRVQYHFIEIDPNGNINEDTGTDTYELEDGKIKSDDDGEPSYNILKSKTDTYWNMVSIMDDEPEAEIWYLVKPDNFPESL